MKKNFAAIIAVSALMLSMPVAAVAKDATKPVELSAEELATRQSKTYDAPYEVLFPAVMATLQSNGYTNVNASRDAGTATAQTEAKGKVIYNIIWGFGKKKRTQMASIFMEPVGKVRSRLRINLTIVESKQRGFIAQGISDGVPVKVAEPYDAFLTTLDTEIAMRLKESAAAPAS